MVSAFDTTEHNVANKNRAQIKPDCIVMFTDGETFNRWGDNWPAPVLWVIVENPKVMAGVGKTVHVN